jgi:hypothetical protein
MMMMMMMMATTMTTTTLIRGPFETLVDWRQCAAVMQREELTYAKL